MTTENRQLAIVTAGALPEGWTAEGLCEVMLSAQIEQYRFASEFEAVLARHEGDEGLALFPSVDELIERGVELFALASAFENGLTGEGFAGLLSSMDVDTLNGALANFVEHAESVAANPDPVDRILCRHGECGTC